MSNDQRLVVNQLCKATFGKGPGAKYLKILKAKFVDCKVYEPHLQHHEVAFKEGQRDIIMSIIKELDINVEE